MTLIARHRRAARVDLVRVDGAGRAGLARARRRLRRRRIAAPSDGRARASTAAASNSRKRGVNECVAKGLSVIQGDADADLDDYPDDAFDFVILSQTLQATRRPRRVLENMLRIGRRAIVSVPNFGHWRVRAQLASRGRMPVTEKLRLFLVRHAEHPFLHHRRFRRARARSRGGDRRLRRAGRPRRAPLHRLAALDLEPRRRAGDLPAASRGPRRGPGARRRETKRACRRRGRVTAREPPSP